MTIHENIVAVKALSQLKIKFMETFIYTFSKTLKHTKNNFLISTKIIYSYKICKCLTGKLDVILTKDFKQAMPFIETRERY